MSRQAKQPISAAPSAIPYAHRLARLVFVPAFRPARERLDDTLGPELTRFLLAALTAEGRGGTGFAA